MKTVEEIAIEELKSMAVEDESASALAFVDCMPIEDKRVMVDFVTRCLTRIDAERGKEAVAIRTFDGEGGYDYRGTDGDDTYIADFNARNPNHIGWAEPLFLSPAITEGMAMVPKAMADDPLRPDEPINEQIDHGNFVKGWNACRDSMLAAAQGERNAY